MQTRLRACVTNGDSLQSCWSDEEHSREVAIAIQGAVTLSSFLLSLYREATGGKTVPDCAVVSCKVTGFCSYAPEAAANSQY